MSTIYNSYDEIEHILIHHIIEKREGWNTCMTVLTYMRDRIEEIYDKNFSEKNDANEFNHEIFMVNRLLSYICGEERTYEKSYAAIVDLVDLVSFLKLYDYKIKISEFARMQKNVAPKE